MRFFWQKYNRKMVGAMLFFGLTLIFSVSLAYPSKTYAFCGEDEGPEEGSFSIFCNGAKGTLKDAGKVGASVFNFASWAVGSDVRIDEPVNELDKVKGKKPAGDIVLEAVGKVLYYLATVLFVVCKGIYEMAGSLISSLIKFSISNAAINRDIINSMWGIVKDIANLTLIFILMYISVSTVLGLSGSNTYKMLGKVILVGLLMNFSLVFTNIIIDTSNIFALQFLKGATNGGKASIGNIFTEKLRLEHLMNTADKKGDDKDTKDLNHFNMAVTMLGVSAFLLIATFVLGVGAAMFMVRIIKLMAIMIFSPLAFAASILPKSEGLTKQWWGELTGNAFLAPAYLFMIYISFQVIGSIKFPETSFETAVNFVTGTTDRTAQTAKDTVQLITGFGLGIGLLTMASVVASNMSKDTAKAGGTLASFALGTGAGTLAALGRDSIGSRAQRIYERAPEGSVTRVIADNLRKNSFDVRNAPVIGGAAEMAAGQAGISTKEGIGYDASKGGFTVSKGQGVEGGGYKKTADEARAKAEKEKKERSAEDRRIKTAEIIKELEKPSPNLTDNLIQEKMSNLNAEEQTELAEKNPDMIKHLNNGSAIKGLRDKADATESKRILDLISGNAANEGGRRALAEDIKKDVEKKAGEDFQNFIAGIDALTPPAEIRNRLITLQPNVILNQRETIMNSPHSQDIMRQLPPRAINAFFTDYVNGGKTSGDDMLAMEAAVGTNPANTGANRLFDSDRIKEQMPT